MRNKYTSFPGIFKRIKRTGKIDYDTPQDWELENRTILYAKGVPPSFFASSRSDVVSFWGFKRIIPETLSNSQHHRSGCRSRHTPNPSRPSSQPTGSRPFSLNYDKFHWASESNWLGESNYFTGRVNLIHSPSEIFNALVWQTCLYPIWSLF